MSTSFFVLHQTRATMHRHRVSYFSLRMSDDVAIEVLPLTQAGVLQALMHAIPGYKVRLITFKNVERPHDEETLIAMCNQQLEAGHYKELSAKGLRAQPQEQTA